MSASIISEISYQQQQFFFKQIDAAVIALNTSSIEWASQRQCKFFYDSSKKVQELAIFANAHFTQAASWNLNQTIRDMDFILIQAMSPCSTKEDINDTPLMKTCHKIINHLSEIKTNLQLENQIQLDPGYFVKKIAELEAKVHRLSEQVKDLEGKNADKRAPSSKRGWFS